MSRLLLNMSSQVLGATADKTLELLIELGWSLVQADSWWTGDCPKKDCNFANMTIAVTVLQHILSGDHTDLRSIRANACL
jgi:hypothetical protein